MALAVGCLGGAGQALAEGQRAIVISEPMEQLVMERTGNRGVLMDVASGNPSRGVTVAVHGIRGAPDAMQPILDEAASKGGLVQAFVYDDNHQRLDDVSHDLAGELARVLTSERKGPLEIKAHSMGARVVLGALRELNDQGLLDHKVHVTLLAPTLEGYRAADFAVLCPTVLCKSIPGVIPGKDMGRGSDYQQRLEELTLPDTVKTTIYQGEKDPIVEWSAPGFVKIAKNLKADVVYVRDGNHVDVLDSVAAHQMHLFSPIPSLR